MSFWKIDDLLLRRVQTHVWSTDEASQAIIHAICKAEGITAIAEIGTCIGATSAYLADRGIKVYTCDIQDQRDRYVIGHKNIRFTLGTVDDLFKTAPKLKAAFIDGDHSYEALVKDFNACMDAGVEIFFIHDCMGVEDVKRFCAMIGAVMINTFHDGIPGHLNGLAIFRK